MPEQAIEVTVTRPGGETQVITKRFIPGEETPGQVEERLPYPRQYQHVLTRVIILDEDE